MENQLDAFMGGVRTTGLSAPRESLAAQRDSREENAGRHQAGTKWFRPQLRFKRSNRVRIKRAAPPQLYQRPLAPLQGRTPLLS